jgi:hypothetical protein
MVVVVVVVEVVGEYKLPIRSSDSDASLQAGASLFLPSPQSVSLVCRDHKCFVWGCKMQNLFYSRCILFTPTPFSTYLYRIFLSCFPYNPLVSVPSPFLIPFAPFSAMITKLRIPILRSVHQAREDFSIYTFPEHQRLLLEVVPSNMIEELLVDGFK